MAKDQDDSAIRDWLERDIVEIYDAMKDDAKRARSVADVRARLAAEHKRATK